MANLTIKNTTLFVFSDERGGIKKVPDNEPFLIGGLAIKGEKQLLLARANWSRWQNEKSVINKKGTKWDDDLFPELASFLIANKIHPISAHILMTKELQLKAKSKLEQLIPGKTNKNRPAIYNYIWILSFVGAYHLAINCFATSMRPIKHIKLHVDPTVPMPKRLVDIFLDHIQLSGEEYCNKIRAALKRRRQSDTQWLDLLTHGANWKEPAKLDFIGNDELVGLADRICALAGRAEENWPGAIRAKQLLEETYRSPFDNNRPAGYLFYNLANDFEAHFGT